MLPYIKDNSGSYTVMCNNKTHTFDTEHKRYDELIQCVKSGDSDGFMKLFAVGEIIQEWSEGDFRLSGGKLFYKTFEIHPVIQERIMSLIEEEFDHQHMLRFLENLYENSSYHVVENAGLYDFLVHSQLPITSDGCFLAQKACVRYSGDTTTVANGTVVSGDLVDKYTRGKSGPASYRNNVGDKPSVARLMVDDNRDAACSHGLHVGAIDYVNGYAGADGVIVIVKVNPKDVVSIPHDSSCQKVRCCAYEVVGIYDGDIKSTVVTDFDVWENDDDNDYEDDDDEFYYEQW